MKYGDNAKALVNLLNGCGSKDYMLYILTYNLAPTLCGCNRKPATIITLSKDNRNIYDTWKEYGNKYKEMLALKVLELRHTCTASTLLFYDENSLINVISNEENKKFLEQFGYSCCMNLDQYLAELKHRFQSGCPHEMGIFLGFPAKDVEGFIEFHGRNYIICGYWKVYYNVESAAEKFRMYNEAKDRVLDMMAVKNNIYDVINAIKQ